MKIKEFKSYEIKILNFDKIKRFDHEQALNKCHLSSTKISFQDINYSSLIVFFNDKHFRVMKNRLSNFYNQEQDISLFNVFLSYIMKRYQFLDPNFVNYVEEFRKQLKNSKIKKGKRKVKFIAF